MSSGDADRKLLFATVALWLGILALYWPHALSFADEVGYVGQAKLLLAGQLRPTRLDPGIWLPGPHGLTSKYPLQLSALIAPLLALSPRAVFAIGVASALALAQLAARQLHDWGRRPLWALLMLAHPTLVIMARTAMADVLLSALGVAAWAALRRGRGAVIAVLFACLCCIKPTGAVIAGCLLAGEAARVLHLRRVDSSSTQPVAWRAIAYAAFGALLGAAITLLSTFLATGGLRSGYQLGQTADQPFFSLVYAPDHLPVYATALLLCPPLLVLGVLPLWRRREFGAVAAVAGLCALMSVYFFVDRGATWFESVVVSQRLILPAVSFLLIGYADGLAGWTEQRPRLRALCTPALIAAPLAVTLAVAMLHERWQAPMARALAAAAPFADRSGHALALTEQAFKAGLLYAGRTRVFDPSAERAPVVLCSTKTWSHRAQVVHTSCAFDGYRSAVRVDDFEVLVLAP